MKISVIGTGKTGGTILQSLDEDAIGFNRSHRPNAEEIGETDAAIIFVPGEAAEEIIEILLQANVPAVWGTTGYKWPAGLAERVKSAGQRWVIGSNFSLGMNIVRKTLNLIGKGSSMLQNPEFFIHEVHHTEKKDAPSGTAISWQEWLGQDALITSERVGDVKGIHEMQIKTKNESICLKHEAHSREVFAEGAIWTARYLVAHTELKPGIYPFSGIFDHAYRELL